MAVARFSTTDELVGRAQEHELVARDSAPCPRGNGTTIGSFQDFEVQCGIALFGDTLGTPNADSFKTCVDLCASHHPRCDGVTFDGTECDLKAGARADRSRPSRRKDAALAQFGKAASSNCGTLGGAQTALGKRFGTFCNFVLNGHDVTQNFAPTFQDCMGQCAGTTGCNAVSFDASQEQGFKNCYLKSNGSPGDNIAQKGIDTAIVNAGLAGSNNSNNNSPADNDSSSSSVAAVAASSSSTPPPSSSIAVVPSSTAVATVPLISTISSSADVLVSTPAGVVFFTPPTGTATPLSTLVAASPIVTTQIIVSLVTSNAQAIEVTETMTMTMTTPISTPEPTSTILDSDTDPAAAATASSSSASTAAEVSDTDDDPSQAWIAAPVVGSAAAVVLIVLMFVMLGRRRNKGRGSRGSGGSSASQRHVRLPSQSPGLFATWLPGSPRRHKTRMGNFSQVTGQRPPSRASSRSSVANFLRPISEKVEDVEQARVGTSDGRDSASGLGSRAHTPEHGQKMVRLELPDDMNGLGLNKWTPSQGESR